MIPCTRNHAGFPGGVAGAELVGRMQAQALEFGAEIARGTVRSLSREAGFFVAQSDVGVERARSVMLATGVTNRGPTMDKTTHDEAVATGRLRYCPVCDGFEVVGQNVAIVGAGTHGFDEAVFVRGFTDKVTLVSPGPEPYLDDARRRDVRSMGIAMIAGPALHFSLDPHGLSFDTGAGRMSFDAVYPAMGSTIHSGLAGALGARLSETGCILVDAHQRTNVPGLYAAGDVVIGLDQISHAMGQAGVGATAIRNDLAKERPLLA